MNVDTREIREFNSKFFEELTGRKSEKKELTEEEKNLLANKLEETRWRELKNCPMKVCGFFQEKDGKMFCTATRKTWRDKRCFGTSKVEEIATP